MGAISSKKATGQILLIGPPEAGKTTLLYALIFAKSDDQATRTTGFHFEQLSGGEGQKNHIAGVWDVAGSSSYKVV
jgi:small GTP-binding protein